jgi:hypothetical protein
LTTFLTTGDFLFCPRFIVAFRNGARWVALQFTHTHTTLSVFDLPDFDRKVGFNHCPRPFLNLATRVHLPFWRERRKRRACWPPDSAFWPPNLAYWRPFRAARALLSPSFLQVPSYRPASFRVRAAGRVPPRFPRRYNRASGAPEAAQFQNRSARLHTTLGAR